MGGIRSSDFLLNLLSAYTSKRPGTGVGIDEVGDGYELTYLANSHKR